MTLVFPEGGKKCFIRFVWFFFLSSFFLRFGLNCCGFVFVVIFFFLLFLSVPYIFIYKDMNIFISEIGGYNVDSIEKCFFFLYCI